MLYSSTKNQDEQAIEFALLRAGLLHMLAHDERSNGGQEAAFWKVVSEAAGAMARLAERINKPKEDDYHA